MKNLLFFLHFLVVFGVNIPFQHVDIGRTGTNTMEYKLTPKNVNTNTFGQLFTVTLDAAVAGQPLYVQNVPVNGVLFNVLYAYTNNGVADNAPSSIWAIDADKGTILWQLPLTPNTISMTATPAIDVTNFIMYVVSKNTVSTGDVLLHAIDIRNGTELIGSPTTVTATVPGTGLGSSNGQIVFGSGHEDARGAILLANGMIYVGFGGGLPAAGVGFHVAPYHGWIFAYTYSTTAGFNLANTFISTPNSDAGGVWQAGKGLSSDGNFVFASTGFGTFNLATNDMAMSFIKFSSSLAIADFFTPGNETFFTAHQEDAGNAGIVVLPGENNAVLWAGGTKYFAGHLMNANNMGKFKSGVDTCLQTVPIAATNPVGQEPVAWDAGSSKFIYLWPTGNNILQYTYTTTTVTFFEKQAITNGGSLAVTSNGKTNGILWTVGNDGNVRAFLGTDISNTLWSAKLPTTPGLFQFPTAVNSKLYVPTSGTTLVAYGVLNPTEVALQFTVQPLSSVGTPTSMLGVPLSSFQVSVVDANGNVVASSWSVTISITGNVLLTGNLTQPCINGVATFTGITIGTAGVFSFNAVTPTLLSAQSSAILVLSNQMQGGSSSSNINNAIVQQNSGNGTAALIGGLVGGLGGFLVLAVIVAASLIYYREWNLRNADRNYIYNPPDLQPPNEGIPTMALSDIQHFKMEPIQG